MIWNDEKNDASINLPFKADVLILRLLIICLLDSKSTALISARFKCLIQYKREFKYYFKGATSSIYHYDDVKKYYHIP